MGGGIKNQLLRSAAAVSFATVCSLTAVCSPAMAAPPLPPPVPFYNWTGFYIGGNAGYSWGQGAVQYNEPTLGFFGLPTSISGSNQLNGGIGGFQAGYNWQINNLWIVGLETDIQKSSETANKTSNFPHTFNDGESTSLFNLSGTLSSKIDWFGTVRGRVGYLIIPTVFVYGTGGLAYGQVNASGTFSDSFCTPAPACTWSFNQTATKVGWALGAGFEGAIPSSRNWSWKVEYLHIDLGSLSGTGFDNDFGGPYSWSARFTDDILRVGLNYRIP
jgi:outer membrane immunogenic protein